MTYYIDPIVFYLMDVASDLKILFSLVMIISVILLVALFPIGSMNYPDEEIKLKHRKAVKWLTASFVISCILFVSIPSTETMNRMLIASFVTKENVEMTVEGAKEVIDYIIESSKEINEVSESNEE